MRSVIHVSGTDRMRLVGPSRRFSNFSARNRFSFFGDLIGESRKLAHAWAPHSFDGFRFTFFCVLFPNRPGN